MTTHNYVRLIEKRSRKDEITGCWHWIGAKHRQGYGFVRHKEKMRTIQRVMAIESGIFGDAAFDMNLRVGNTCRNKLCANPEHLIMQTHTEVMNRRYQDFGSSPRFSDQDCLRILDDYNALGGLEGKYVVKQLCKQYECNHQMIYRMMERAKKYLEEKNGLQEET